MLDVKFLRENPEKAKEGIQKKKKDPKLIDKFLRVDEEWRGKVLALEELQKEQNQISRELAKGKSDDLVSKAHILKKRITEIDAERAILETKRNDLLLALPNIPFDDVPFGNDESENKILREVGKKPVFNFPPKDYMTLGEALDIIDTKKAAAVAGSRFGYIKRDLALVEFALVKVAFDIGVQRGFIPVVPPVMIRPDVYENIGRLAADQKEERYFLEKDQLYLVGSSEHTLAPLHMNDTFLEKELPRRYIAFSSCFRREAGSYGKDTKGILRVHQFDKVELFSFAHPEKSEEEHQFLLETQEEIMKALALPYRVVEICTGDMGWTDARQFDIETWMPGQGTYRETNSCSNTTDFQSRGIAAKFKSGDGKKQLVHTLNATACAVGRTLIALIENGQTKQGTIKLPKILEKHTGIKEIK